MLATQVKLSRVPYKSTGPALLGLLTNEVHLVFATAGAAMPHVKDGHLKALGVTSIQPFPLIPGVPDLGVAGPEDYDLDTIGFILAPAKTPPNLVKTLHAHIVQIMHQPDVKERLAAGGSDLVTGTPPELARSSNPTMQGCAGCSSRSGFRRTGRRLSFWATQGVIAAPLVLRAGVLLRLLRTTKESRPFGSGKMAVSPPTSIQPDSRRLHHLRPAPISPRTIPPICSGEPVSGSAP